MREHILHFIWKYQYFDVSKAVAEAGDSIIIIQQGFHNHDAGPDFGQAKLRIGNVDWVGDVEIHVKSSEWNSHKHQFDKSYNKVILHVVWENDKTITREDGTHLPVLILKDLVDLDLLNRVDVLINSIEAIPCSSQLSNVSKIVISDTIQKSLVKRLERKSKIALNELEKVKGDWNEVAYRLFMCQMGMKVNGDSFYDLAQILPYGVLKKYQNKITSIEALLFGMSGLLNGRNQDEYTQSLRSEFDFLTHKHNLTASLKPELWKFMRLRPSNFPSLRLAQAASLFAKFSNIFELFSEYLNKQELVDNLKLTSSEYWKSHYRFGVEAKKVVPSFGQASISLLILNVVTPLLAAYAFHIDSYGYMEKAIELTELIKPENNRIIREWNLRGVKPKNGAESQGLIELFNESCLNKKCLSCGIGYSILKKV